MEKRGGRLFKINFFLAKSLGGFESSAEFIIGLLLLVGHGAGDVLCAVYYYNGFLSFIRRIFLILPSLIGLFD